MDPILIFGLGYCARYLAQRIEARGGAVAATTRDGQGGTLRFDDRAGVLSALRTARYVVSSVPPGRDGRDPVLDSYGEALALAPLDRLIYWSSTGVYGDTGGAWVDETAPLQGRRGGRIAADRAWAALRPDVSVLRLPGIYGPGRSTFDRLQDGTAHRVDCPGQVFSRVHVADVVGGTLAALRGPAGTYNLADDLPASQADVVAGAAAMLGIAPPPLVALDDANLSPMARAFYAENRRVANGRAGRQLGWRPLYATWREGLSSIAPRG